MNKARTPQEKYKVARTNLLVVVLFTVLNIILILADIDRSFLFSAFIPQVMVFWGLNKVEGIPEFSSFGTGLMISVALLIILIYLLSYLFSKKKAGWMITALVLFSIDCIVFAVLAFPGFQASYLIDILFHAWVMYYLILGVKNAEEAILNPEPVLDFNATYDGAGVYTGNPEGEGPLTTSDLGLPLESKKEKILIRYSSCEMDIQVRRTPKLIELIINGKVYARKEESVIQTNYRISAMYKGIKVETEYNQASQILYVDGVKMAGKTRFF